MTSECVAKKAEHWPGQSMPAGAEVTRPSPSPASDTRTRTSLTAAAGPADGAAPLLFPFVTPAEVQPSATATTTADRHTFRNMFGPRSGRCDRSKPDATKA